MNKFLTRGNLLLLAICIGIILFTFVLYKIYIPRASSFGCFDDCFNFMGGYFFSQGKTLYSQIFFNHAPAMAYLSYAIQSLTDPINLYDLVLQHRKFVLLFSLVFNLILFLRFKYKVLGVILIYELSKFYLFGDRFLAEALIVYPIMYLSGLAWEKLSRRKLYTHDLFASGVFAWLVIVMREPYVPLALFLFAVIVVRRNIRKISILPVITLGILLLFTFFYHNSSDLIFNALKVNQNQITSGGSYFQEILKSIFYPFYIFLTGQNTILHTIEILLSVLFLLQSALFLKDGKHKQVALVWICLILANLRPTQPGVMFFEAFHMLVWFVLMLFFSFSFLWELKLKKPLWHLVLALYLIPVILLLIPGRSYLYDQIDENTNFITNYGSVLHVGEVVSVLSTPSDTLFLDGFDDMIYWVSKRNSDYKYSWYTSLMPDHKLYTDARIEMFRDNPPDFYYGTCQKNEIAQRILPEFVKNDYVRLESGGKPTCLWVKKSKIPKISEDQWKMANEKFYSLPEKTSKKD